MVWGSWLVGWQSTSAENWKRGSFVLKDVEEMESVSGKGCGEGRTDGIVGVVVVVVSGW